MTKDEKNKTNCKKSVIYMITDAEFAAAHGLELRRRKIGHKFFDYVEIPANNAVREMYNRATWQELKQDYRNKNVAFDDSYHTACYATYPSDGAIEGELLSIIKEDLDDANRRIIQLLIEGYKEKEIAVELGISQRAVNKRRHKIQAIIGKKYKNFSKSGSKK